jgi:hypothetical protein
MEYEDIKTPSKVEDENEDGSPVSLDTDFYEVLTE